MCGITGLLKLDTHQSVDPEILRKMNESQSHRGPDGEGYFFDEKLHLAFAHKRLSIIDIDRGKQPMSDSKRNIWITFNGEIYNFIILKNELINKGYSFKTKSDTEVIIYLYMEYGIEGFEKLNGIFAFALYDRRKKVVVLVRDRFGVKPLYYFHAKDLLLFGSEIKSIFEYPYIKRELDYSSFDSFLTFRYNPSPQTLFKGIMKLPPGYFFKINCDDSSIEEGKYFNYKPSIDNNIGINDAINEYKFLLKKSIKSQMISDVPVGMFLSGGIDSAIIAYHMQNQLSKPLNTFTIGFPGQGDYNELSDARETAKLLGTNHNELTITKDEYLEFFFKSFYYTEEPIAEPTIPALYFLAKYTSKHLKVVLAGQGADEPLGGYPRYIGEKYLSKYGSLFRYIPDKIISSAFPANEKLKRAFYAANFENNIDRFLAIYTIITPKLKKKLLNHDINLKLINRQREIVEKLYNETEFLDDSLSKLFYIDTRLSLSDSLLLFGDKITMANGIEMRVPFLDNDLIRFLESIPSHYKIKLSKQKYLHKKAIKGWLPNKIINRKKRGFQTPIDEWLKSDFTEYAKEFLCSKNSISGHFFKVGEIKNIIDDHRNSRSNNQRLIFLLLSFEAWYRKYF